MRRILQLAVLILVFNSIPSWSDQNNSEIDELFRLLHEATSPAEASVLTRQIWHNWYQSDNKDIEVLMQQGEIRMRSGKLDQAVKIYSRIIDIDPGFAEGWNRRATAYYMMGELQNSTADVVETLKLEPRHFGALSGQGMIYTQLRQVDLALEYYEKALEVNPHMTGVRISIEAIKKHLKKEAI